MLSNTQARNASPSNSNQNLSVHQPRQSRPGHMRNAFLSAMPGKPPLCTPKTSARPPPTCPASPRDRLSCAPNRGCRGVVVPVGTRRLPRLGGAALLPGGSRWSAEVSKHEKSPSSGPMGHGKGRISQQRPPFLDYSENILFQALVKHSLNSERGATKNYDTCLHLR